MSTKMQDDAATEAAKKQMADDKKALELSQAQYARKTKGKPTPTQEENDLAACGAHILEHEADGSDPDPFVPSDKSMEASHPSHSGARPQTYQTRTHKAQE